MHDEGPGYGITVDKKRRNNGCYVGWVQQAHVGPNKWFDHDIAVTETGKLTDKCWSWDSDCDGGKK